MSHTFAGAGGKIVTFPVVKTNPSGMIVRFTITDTAGLLTTFRMIRAVLCDAIDQFLAAERADLNTNGDSAIIGPDVFDQHHVGGGYGAFSWNLEGKYAQVTLTALTSIATTGTITVTPSFPDVI